MRIEGGITLIQRQEVQEQAIFSLRQHPVSSIGANRPAQERRIARQHEPVSASGSADRRKKDR